MKDSKAPAPAAKTALLDSAFNLMIARGYAGTSVDEVCSAAGYTKGTFFYYFENKEDMGLSLLARQREAISTLEGLPCLQVEDPLQKFVRYVDFVALMCQHPIGNSCIVGMFAEELAEASQDIRELCDQTFSDWTASVERMLRRSAERYPVRGNPDFRALAEHFIAVFEGSVILGRARNSVEPIRKNLAIYRDHICGLFGCDAHSIARANA